MLKAVIHWQILLSFAKFSMYQISPNDYYLSWISSDFYLGWKPKLTIHMRPQSWPLLIVQLGVIFYSTLAHINSCNSSFALSYFRENLHRNTLTYNTSSNLNKIFWHICIQILFIEDQSKKNGLYLHVTGCSQ